MLTTRTASLLSAVALVFASASSSVFAADGVPRTASGHPDLTGTYDAATLTPLERPPSLGEKAYLTPEEAQALADEEADLVAKGLRPSDADREAPPEGGAKVVGLEETATGGNEFGAGNVGGYNLFWIDRGSDTFIVDGKIPTSIIVDPANGRMPAMTPTAAKEMMERFSSFLRPNDGSAWWLEKDGPGPYDGPESLAMSERCILGFTGATPTLPSLYNNYKTIVQTEDHVMILIEMVHDARVVRLNSEHPGPEVKKWMGDSIGWWEGDTLVVDHPEASMRGGSENLHVVERFTPRADGNILYRFTVEDPTVWTAPWTGEYVWRASDERLYEYACHEGNYAMGNVLRGARLLEDEARAAK
jgi:hypothetical protein